MDACAWVSRPNKHQSYMYCSLNSYPKDKSSRIERVLTCRDYLETGSSLQNDRAKQNYINGHMLNENLRNYH